MKKVKIIVSIIISVVLMSASLAFTAGTKETYKIGVVSPLSGDYAFIGEAMKNALLMAKDEHSGDKYNYELIFEDSQNESKLNASAANKLIDVDKVDAIISLGSTAGPIITPIATKSKTLHYSISVQPYIAEGLTNFIHWAPSKSLNELLAKEMKKRGIKTFGVFRSTSYEGWGIYLKDLLEAAKSNGLKMVTDQTFQADSKDFRSLIAKAGKSNPDIYVLFCGSPAMEILTKQMREAGIDTPLTSVESFELTKEKDLFEGAWYVSAAHASDEFNEAYKARYNKDVAVGGPNAYDIFNLIAYALHKAEHSSKPTSEQIARELLKIKNFKGSLGNLSIVDIGITLSGVDLKMIKEGKPVKLSH